MQVPAKEPSQTQEYELASETRLSSGVGLMEWCQNMDLVGMITDNNVLEVGSPS